jgi:hypothetical protein
MAALNGVVLAALCGGVMAALGGGMALAQPSPADPAAPPAVADGAAVPLEWTPPALAELGAEAVAKSSFTLDRAMLNAAAGAMGEEDAPTRQAINRLDGVSVHFLRFPEEGMEDAALVNEIRAAYHVRGWKHVVTTTQAGGPMHDRTTDVWVVTEGVNLRGAVVLAQSGRTLTLATVAGNLSPVDLLHLRGHFGIPNFEENTPAGDRNP